MGEREHSMTWWLGGCGQSLGESAAGLLSCERARYCTFWIGILDDNFGPGDGVSYSPSSMFGLLVSVCGSL